MTEESYSAKRNYFESQAFSVLSEMRLLFRGGQLWSADEWRNVVEHCVVEVAAARELSKLLILSDAQTTALISVIAIHDWQKRLEKAADSPTTKPLSDQAAVQWHKVKQAFGEKFSDLHLEELMAATTKDFIFRGLAGQASWLEKLIFYVDEITSHTEIVSLEERIREVSLRQPELNQDLVLTERLGGVFWEKELQLGRRIEQEIWQQLTTEVQVEISQPSQISHYLQQKITQHYQR